MKKLLLLSFLILVFPATALSQGSSKPQPAPPEIKSEPLTQDEVLKLIQINRLETEARLYAIAPTPDMAKENPSAKLAQLYKEAAASPRLMRHLLGQRRDDYLKNRNAARSAPQATQAANEASVEMLHIIAAQNAAIIEQNARIINLLERMAPRR